ncbi:hypothetical protein FSP39_005471 [Pinctada imbricata]|uniref:C-type lectin domain-containing protein n=1 Tax=Pinctada imbricata TaxID=66713 RepID=A0AA89BPY5_PINIB|nr:hypothetical protein FSP39_005471 [Pinctada imbricata]
MCRNNQTPFLPVDMILLSPDGHSAWNLTNLQSCIRCILKNFNLTDCKDWNSMGAVQTSLEKTRPRPPVLSECRSDSSGENSVHSDDACYVIIPIRTSFDRAKVSCNVTGGYLWKTSDREDVFERIKDNPKFTGFFWVDNDTDITIGCFMSPTLQERHLGIPLSGILPSVHGLPVRKMCPPAIEFGSYDAVHGLKMFLNLYTRSFLCWGSHAYICKYDTVSVRTAEISSDVIRQDVPLFGFIVLSAVAFLLFVALLVLILTIVLRRRRRKGQSKGQNLVATPAQNPDMYDEAWSSPRLDTSTSHTSDQNPVATSSKNPNTYDEPWASPRLDTPISQTSGQNPVATSSKSPNTYDEPWASPRLDTPISQTSGQNPVATSSKSPNTYDEPWASPHVDTPTSQTYDFPLEAKDITETLLGRAKKQKQQFPWFDSNKKSAQVRVSRNSQFHEDNDSKGTRVKGLYNHNRKSATERQTDNESESDPDIAGPSQKNKAQQGKFKNKYKDKVEHVYAYIEENGRKKKELRSEENLYEPVLT